MEPNVRNERGSCSRSSTPWSRADLAWAEVAGLVRVNPDGSWTATELARSWLKRAEASSGAAADDHAAGGTGGSGRAKISF
jgi:hypothetical protein